MPVLSALPHLRKVNLGKCKLGVEGCMPIAARALTDRDSIYVNLLWNDFAIGSIEGDELHNMPGLNVWL